MLRHHLQLSLYLFSQHVHAQLLQCEYSSSCTHWPLLGSSYTLYCAHLALLFLVNFGGQPFVCWGCPGWWFFWGILLRVVFFSSLLWDLLSLNATEGGDLLSFCSFSWAITALQFFLQESLSQYTVTSLPICNSVVLPTSIIIINVFHSIQWVYPR